eukprot:UC1_evm2s2103
MMRVSCVVLVVVAALALALPLHVAQAESPANQCGTYETTCVQTGDGVVTARYVVDGISTGLVSVTMATYPTNAACASGNAATISVDYSGTWTDLGPNATGRTWELRVGATSGFDVTASGAGVQQLQSACPCGGTWADGVLRTLGECPTGTCQDTTFLGGTQRASGMQGIIIGAPAYGTTLVGTDGSIQISRLDQDWNMGASLDPTAPSTQFLSLSNKEACSTPSTNGDFCGVWSLSCTFARPRDGVAAMTSDWSYDGPAMPDYEAGTFERHSTWYTDSQCNTPTMSISTGGSYMQKGSSAGITGGTKNIERPLYFLVTPEDDSAVDDLRNECPCGDPDKWVIGQQRTITQCPGNNACSAWWMSQVQPGIDEYSGQLRLDMDFYSQIQITKRFSTLGAADAAGLQATTDLPYILVPNSCRYGIDTYDDYCGLYETKCAAVSDGPSDFSDSIQFTGTAGNSTYATDAGYFQRTYSTYQPGMSCEKESMILSVVYRDGVWKDEGPALSLIPGGRNVLIVVPLVEVTPYTQNMADTLNTLCPCNGKWASGVVRYLDSCSVDECPSRAWLPGASNDGGGDGVLGEPGFGVVRLSDVGMRMSSLMLTEDKGFNQFLGVDVLPTIKSVDCKATNPNYDYCGEYTLPCGSVGSDVTSGYDSKGDMILKANGQLILTKTYYNTGDGCLGDVAVVQMEVLIEATLDSSAASDAIPFAHQITATGIKAGVKPITDSAVSYLQAACPCVASGGSSPWAKNKEITLQGQCPKGTCSNTLFLGFPAGETTTGYGGIQRFSQFLRFTRMLPDQQGGHDTTFNTTDRSFLLENNAECPTGPSGSTDDSGAIVAVAVIFGLVAAYFIFGMLINHRRTGAATVPHVEFWKTLPGLITEGITFSLCQCFGLRADTGPKYQSAQFNENAVEEGTSGYGAL